MQNRTHLPILHKKAATNIDIIVTGMSICAAFMFFNALLAFSLRTYLVWENKKFERLDAAARAEGIDPKQGEIGLENEGYGFRNFL
jgi:hypothetical protein